MSRAGIVLLAGIIAGAHVPLEVDAAAKKTKTTAKSSKASKSAKSKQATAKKRTAKKSRVAKSKSKRERKRSRGGKRVAIVEKVSRKTEGMPPGWMWPPDAPMKQASVACEQQLDSLGIVWERATPEGRIVDPIYVPSMEIGGIKYISAYKSGPHRLDCQFVLTLAAVGPELYAVGVREVKFGSIYRNTNVRAHGATKPILSRHALGIAMDIKSFTDTQGRVAIVELDYLKGDPLLHSVEDAINRTERFRAVLTPGNDPISHYDHFHIEAFVDYTPFR
jgi:hypothetical protein